MNRLSLKHLTLRAAMGASSSCSALGEAPLSLSSNTTDQNPPSYFSLFQGGKKAHGHRGPGSSSSQPPCTDSGPPSPAHGVTSLLSPPPATLNQTVLREEGSFRIMNISTKCSDDFQGCLLLEFCATHAMLFSYPRTSPISTLTWSLTPQPINSFWIISLPLCSPGEKVSKAPGRHSPAFDSYLLEGFTPTSGEKIPSV